MQRRTSKTDPLRIAEIVPPGCAGTIGITFCPGKHDDLVGWARDLDLDLDAIRDWGADVVVTLVDSFELALLRVRRLSDGVTARGMEWRHLPIRDVSIPDEGFERNWDAAGADLCARLRDGGRVVVHCRGGLGRAGTIAARLLVELGMDPEKAIAEVRRVRPGAIETREQAAYIRNRAWENRPRN